MLFRSQDPAKDRQVEIGAALEHRIARLELVGDVEGASERDAEKGRSAPQRQRDGDGAEGSVVDASAAEGVAVRDEAGGAASAAELAVGPAPVVSRIFSISVAFDARAVVFTPSAWAIASN